MTKVPFFDLKKQFVPLREEILNEIAAVCDAQAFILGAKVDRFEEAIASLCGGRSCRRSFFRDRCRAFDSDGFGIGPGDAVVTTPFTFFSTAGCIARLGARPVYVDIDPDTFSLSPERLELFFADAMRF